MKNRMKRVMGALLLGVLLCGLLACGENGGKPQELSFFAMKGPTGMGLSGLINDAAAGKTELPIHFQLADSAEEGLPDLIAGRYDFACIPTNLAAVLAQKAADTYRVMAVNTLGVLYLLDRTGEIHTVEDLRGRKLVATGEGLIPQLCLDAILQYHGMSEEDLTVEYYPSATDAGNLLLSGQTEIAMLPQPYAMSLMMKDDGLKIALDFNAEWEKSAEGSSGLMTGCLVVRRELLEQSPETVRRVGEWCRASIDLVNRADDAAAQAVVDAGIVPATALAKAAIPYCNLTYLTGEDMKRQLQGFYEVIYPLKPSLLGGKLPDETLYYLP